MDDSMRMSERKGGEGEVFCKRQRPEGTKRRVSEDARKDVDRDSMRIREVVTRESRKMEPKLVIMKVGWSVGEPSAKMAIVEVEVVRASVYRKRERDCELASLVTQTCQ